MQPSKITAFKSNPTFQVFVFEYLRHYSGKALFFDPPLWSKVIIGNTTFLSYPLHFVEVPTKPALVFHNKLWEEEREKVLKVFSWNAHSIKKKIEFRVHFCPMRNRWVTVHRTPDKDSDYKSNIKEYFLQDLLCHKNTGQAKAKMKAL